MLKNLPATYIYRGKTITNNGEHTVKVKHTTFESLLKGAGLEDDVDFRAEIKPFYDASRPSQTHTMADFMEVMDRACDWLYPYLTREEGREQLGRLSFQGVTKTLYGKVALAALHIIGPHKLVRYAPSLFNDAVTQTQRTITHLGENNYLYSIRKAAGTYEEVIGLIKAGLEAAGAKNVQCRVELLAPDSMDFYVNWE